MDPVGQVSAQNEAPDQLILACRSYGTGAGGRLGQVVDRTGLKGSPQLRHTLGNIHAFEIGADLANHHLARREAEARGAQKPGNPTISAWTLSASCSASSTSRSSP
jgi:hypothetical protein